MFDVSLYLKGAEYPVIFEQVSSTYTKDDLFCIHVAKDYVYKYPLINILCIVEEYGDHVRHMVESPFMAKEGLE